MDCLHIPEITYDKFTKQVVGKGRKLRLPLGASLELTERCNLRCVHCYVNRPAADQKARQQELRTGDWARLLDDMAAAGCLWLLITGGEPLLHPDFREIFIRAKKSGMIITLFTNGTLLSPALADFLLDWPPMEVEISVYGHSKETYEAVTRVPGSYERCLRGIDLLLERRIPLLLKTMVMTLNVHELIDLRTWAAALGVRFRCDPLLQPRLDGGQEPLALRLSPEQVVEVDLNDEQRRRDWQQLVENFWGPTDSEFLYNCEAGNKSLHIDSFGQMSLCIMSRTAGFDLTKGSFSEGWEAISRIRTQKPQGEYPCGHCDVGLFCAVCPPWSQLEMGKPEAPVDYLCRIAHLRAQTFGLDSANKRRVGK